jgi:hypothetical protein
MKVASLSALGGVAAMVFAALAFAGTQHNALLASPVASVRSPSPSASARSPVASPELAQSPEPSESPDSGGSATAGAHPCNHGFYVSQAAHAHKGGHYVSSIAKSNLGKNGDCTVPLPAPAP